MFSLLLQLSFVLTAMQTCVALIPFSIALLIIAIVGARLSARLRAKRIIQVGFIISIAGLVVMQAMVQPESGASDLASGSLLGAVAWFDRRSDIEPDLVLGWGQGYGRDSGFKRYV